MTCGIILRRQARPENTQEKPMPISPMDELLTHQTAETFDQVFTSDRNFYDRYLPCRLQS